MYYYHIATVFHILFTIKLKFIFSFKMKKINSNPLGRFQILSSVMNSFNQWQPQQDVIHQGTHLRLRLLRDSMVRIPAF